MNYLLFIQNIRLASASVFDDFMLHITDMGQALITYLVFAFVYWCVDKNYGQLIAFNISFSCWMNQWSKRIFKIERPWIKYPDIKPVEAALPMASGYSMPSGHTTRALAVWGVWGYCIFKDSRLDKLKRRWLACGIWLIVALVMISRIYLGVHTIPDVLVALIMGIVIMFVCEILLEWVRNEKYRIINDILVCLIGCIIISVSIFWFGCLSNAGTALGVLIGWLLERRLVRFQTNGSWINKVLRFIPGALVIFICYTSGTTIMSHIVDGKYAAFFLNGFASFFIMFLYPVIFKIWEGEGIDPAIRGKWKRWMSIIMAMAIIIVTIVGLIKVQSHLPEFTGEEKEQYDNTEKFVDTDTTDENSIDYLSEQADVKIIAHRGYSGVAPENTLASFERAIDIEADMIELDVQETSDAKLVVFHDTDMSRITGKSGKISDYTYEEICDLNVGKWFGTSFTGISQSAIEQNYESETIPLLEEVLKLIRDSDLDIYLELKDISGSENLSEEQLQRFPQDVVSMVSGYGMENRVIYASFNYDYLEQIKKNDEEARVLYNTSIGDADILSEKYPADYYGLNIETLKKTTIERLQNIGSHVYVWTVNTPYEMKQMMEAGAEGIVTNNPGIAKVILHREYSYISEHYISSLTVPMLYDYKSQDIYGEFIFQGFTKAFNTLVISAYDYTGEKNSILYIMNMQGELLNIVDLGFKAHTGGIAYDEKRDLLWVTGADAYIYAISWSSVLEGDYKGTEDEIIFKYNTDLVKPNGSRAASFMAIDRDMIYVGTYVNGDNGKIDGYNIERLMAQSTGQYIIPDVTYVIPERIQGLTFDYNALEETTVMILTQGYQNEDAALLEFTMDADRVDYSEPDNCYILPEGVEQPLMTSQGLWLLFESSVRPYRETCRVPNDQIWLLSY